TAVIPAIETAAPSGAKRDPRYPAAAEEGAEEDENESESASRAKFVPGDSRRTRAPTPPAEIKPHETAAAAHRKRRAPGAARATRNRQSDPHAGWAGRGRAAAEAPHRNRRDPPRFRAACR